MSKITKLTHEEAKEALKKIHGWELLEPLEETPFIQKVFKFQNYLTGIQFVNQIAHLAETANHHPDLFVTWCRVTVSLTTHDANGLSEKDFSLAAQIDAL